MMLYYRADVFTQFGLTVPKTWDEFADGGPHGAAEEPQAVPHHVLRRPTRAGSSGWPSRPAATGGASTATPGRSRSTTPPRRRSPTTGAAWSTRASSTTKPMYTPEWNKALNDGTLHRLAERGLGTGRAVRQRARHQGQVGDGAAAAVERRREQDRQLGRLVHRGDASSRRTRRPPRSSPCGSTPTRRRRRCWSRRAASTRRRRRRRPDRRWRSRRTFFSNQADFYVAAKRDRRHGGRLHLRPQRQRDLQRLQGRVRQGRHRQVPVLGGARRDADDDRRRHEEERLQRHRRRDPCHGEIHDGAQAYGITCGAVPLPRSRRSCCSPRSSLVPIGYTV